MIAELGQLCLLLALAMALVQGTLPLLGAWRGQLDWMRLARPAAFGQCLFLVLAFAALVWAFLQDDFSVAYVAANSNSRLPWYYKVSATWGAHEGSLLLWALTLSAWSLAVAVFSRQLPQALLARVLGILGLVALGFLAFLVATSNPFARLLPQFPREGNDLNPLLQDPGLILHPPMLYMGYVGFSVAFAFALAALLEGRLDAAWARWARPWTLLAWAFLGCGIVLGSWWAYYELGWGGWWFWDPVENASFMPWLVGTALLHSLAVTEKRGLFKGWTVLLAIAAFSLSLLGTFLVRSGVLTSVHAFASDPARGVFILAFLLLVVGGSLALFAWRAPALGGSASFGLASREALLLINNLILVTAAATVLLGTLYPLVIDSLTGAKLSVGPPYFDLLFVPLMALLMLALGIGVLVRWKRSPGRWLARLLAPILLACVILAGLAAWWLEQSAAAILAVLALAAWVVLTALRDVAGKVAALGWRRGLGGQPRSYWGMQLAHLGLAVLALGVVLASQLDVQRDLRLAPGEHVELGGYRFGFAGTQHYEGPNFTAERALLQVERDGRVVALLTPEKRRYLAGGAVMTEAAIDAGLTRDLYVALGEPLGEGAWAVRIQLKPFVRLIWLGGLLTALGGLLALADPRYRQRRRASRSTSAESL
ncbi:MAG: heme lyase CcmF/NrfE family subunit [Pseudomonas oryzihabitans]